MYEKTSCNYQGTNRSLSTETVGTGSGFHPGENKALYDEFTRREKACRSPRCLTALARQVLSVTADTTYAGMLLSKALALCVDFEENLKVAEVICNDLKDLNWGCCVYRRILDKNLDAEMNERAAESILRALGDRGWARRIYAGLERSAETPVRLAALARNVNAALNDFGWSRRLLEKAEAKLADRGDAVMLADAVREILNDNDWMNRIFLIAERYCRNRFQYEYLIEMVDLKSGDGKLLSGILKRAETKLTSAEDLLYLARTVLFRFEDESWARRIYAKGRNATDAPVDRRFEACLKHLEKVSV